MRLENGTVRRLDLKGNCLATLAGHANPMCSAVFSSDENTIFTTSSCGQKIYPWSIKR